MVKAVLGGLAVAALCVLPATIAPSAHAAETLPLTEAVALLPVATESRDGYDRDKFRHWNAGDHPADGCKKPYLNRSRNVWIEQSSWSGDLPTVRA